MIDEKFIKVGQKFKGQINGATCEIIKIGKNWLGKTYITSKDDKNRISETDIKTFKHLLFDII